MGLDLSSPEAVERTAIGRVAHQTETGESTAEPELAPSRLGRPMAVIAPGDPGDSYLLYKALLQPDLSPLLGLDSAGGQAELQRLRGWVVLGLPMPPDNPLAEDSQASLEQLLLIESWIMNGATTRCP